MNSGCMKCIKYCNSFSLLVPWEKYGSFGFSLGVCPMDISTVACFWGAQCLVEDERLRKCAISSGSATVGTRANNRYEFHYFFFSKLKNLTNKSFAKSRMRLHYVNKYKPQQYGLSRIVALVLSNQFSVGTLTYVA